MTDLTPEREQGLRIAAAHGGQDLKDAMVEIDRLRGEVAVWRSGERWQGEQLAEARAEVERLRGEVAETLAGQIQTIKEDGVVVSRLRAERDEARAEVERLMARSVQEGKARRLGVKFATIDAVADAERLAAALREALTGLVEAYDYACAWPLGLDTDPQEQRGMVRDTIIGNTEYSANIARAALAEHERRGK